MGARNRANKAAQEARRQRAQRIHAEAPGDQSILLPRRRIGPLRIGCISWSTAARSALVLGASTLEESLRAVAQQRSELQADLILCAGAIWTDATEATAKNITASTTGIPVVAEIEPGGDNFSGWWLSSESGWRCVRTRQHFVAANEVYSQAQHTLREIGRGYGVVRFEGCDTALVLLICGEARMLSDRSTDSIIRTGIANRIVPDVFRQKWALLHPSHVPYGARSRPKGFGIVGAVRNLVHTPLLEAVCTSAAGGRSDGTRSAVRTFHAGIWNDERDWCRAVAVRAYPSQNAVVTSAALTGGRLIRYAEFTL
jgi:hypothetical protein